MKQKLFQPHNYVFFAVTPSSAVTSMNIKMKKVTKQSGIKTSHCRSFINKSGNLLQMVNRLEFFHKSMFYKAQSRHTKKAFKKPRGEEEHKPHFQEANPLIDKTCRSMLSCHLKTKI